MAELKFDHTKDADFLEALGMSDNDMKELNMKFASMSHFIITRTPKKSELVQKIAETFSYNELLLACTFFVLDKTTQIMKENPMVALFGVLSDLKKEE
jgi:hypothetical protein